MKKVLAVALTIILALAGVVTAFVGVESKGFKDFSSLKDKFNKQDTSENDIPKEELDVSIESLNEQLNTIKAEVESLAGEKTDLLNRIEEQRATTELLFNAYEENRLAVIELNATIDSLNNDKIELETSINNLQNEIRLKDIEIEDLKENYNSAIGSLEDVQENYSARITQLVEEKQALNVEINNLNSQLSAKDEQIILLQGQLIGKETEIETLREQRNEVDKRISNLNLELNSVKSQLQTKTEMYNSLVNTVLSYDYLYEFGSQEINFTFENSETGETLSYNNTLLVGNTNAEEMTFGQVNNYINQISFDNIEFDVIKNYRVYAPTYSEENGLEINYVGAETVVKSYNSQDWDLTLNISIPSTTEDNNYCTYAVDYNFDVTNILGQDSGVLDVTINVVDVYTVYEDYTINFSLDSAENGPLDYAEGDIYFGGTNAMYLTANEILSFSGNVYNSGYVQVDKYLNYNLGDTNVNRKFVSSTEIDATENSIAIQIIIDGIEYHENGGDYCYDYNVSLNFDSSDNLLTISLNTYNLRG